MMDWINGIRLNLPSLKSKLELLTDEASVLKVLENNNDGLLTMIKLLIKLKSCAVQDSFYELFSLIENTVEVLGSVSKKAKETFILSTAEKCLDVVINPVPLCPVKMEVLRLLNLFLEDTSQKIHQNILKSDESKGKLANLFLDVSTAGDFELQSMMVECLFRFLPTKMAKSKMLKEVQPDPEILSAFLGIRGNKFEVDCRNFLNKLNKQSVFVHKRVLSFPADYVKLDGEKLFKPSEDGYDDFWIDFNTGSKRISIFCQPFLLSSQLTQSEARWETLSLRAQDIKKFDCTASGKVWKIAVELKSNAQLLVHPEAEDQPHLFLCGIKRMYDAKSALNKTFGPKTSTVGTPLMICKKTDSSESSCISFSNVRDHVQAPTFPVSQHKSSSNTSVHDLKQEKSSVPCDLMCYPASSTVSQDSSASNSLCVPDIKKGNEAVKKQNQTEVFAHNNKKEDGGFQSFKGLRNNHMKTSDSVNTYLKKNGKVTQKVETHDKSEKLQGKSHENKSEKVQKHGDKYSTEKDTVSPEGNQNVSALKRNGNADFSQKRESHKQLDNSSGASDLMCQHLASMTPSGDGFSLSIAKPDQSRRQKSPSGCIFRDKKRGKGTVANDRKFQGLLNEDKAKPQKQAQNKKNTSLKLSGCYSQQRPSKLSPLADIADKKGDHSFSTDIIPDSLPGQAPHVSTLACETMTTTKANKSKTKTTLKDILGSGKTSKNLPSRCQENKSTVIKSYNKVISEVENTDKPVINSDSRKGKNNQKKTQSTENKICDISCNRETKIDHKGNDENQRDSMKNKKQNAAHYTKVSFSPKDDQLIDTRKSKECFSLSKEKEQKTQKNRKYDIESLSTCSKPASSESGQLYIEIETTKNNEDTENYNEVISETQIETSLLTATGKNDTHNTQKKTSSSRECNDQSENQAYSSGQCISNGLSDQLHSVPVESSYDFKNKYRESAPQSNNIYVQTISSKMAPKGFEKRKNGHDNGRNLKSNNDPSSNGLNQRKISDVFKEKKLDNKTSYITSTIASSMTKNQVKEKRPVEERPSRTLRARKNINYNETESFNQSAHEDEQPSFLFHSVQLKNQNEKPYWQHSERFLPHPCQHKFDKLYTPGNKPGTKSKAGASSTISKHEESWREVNTSIDKTRGKVKHDVTIKHNQIKTVRSSFTAEDLVDPYDFDFECKIRSRDMQQLIPYKSWSSYSPTKENKKPDGVSQEDKHHKSKKFNKAKTFFRSSQISCQKKITFTDSNKSTDQSKYGDSDTYQHKDKRSDKKRKGNSFNNLGGRRIHSPHIFESHDQFCWKQKSSGYLRSQPDTPRSSESGLRFPPLQDYSPDSPCLHNDAEVEVSSLYDKSASGRSELSWVKAKKEPSKEIRKQRGKTYDRRKECVLNFQKQVSDIENDDLDEELGIASWRSDVNVTSPCQEEMSPLEKSPLRNIERPMYFDTNSPDEIDKQDHNMIKQGLGTLSSILCITDTEKKNAVKEKYSSCKNTSMKPQKSLETSPIDEENGQDSELEEESKSLTSPKLSLGESSQNLSNLSLKFDQLFQEVMSKVSRDEPYLCSERIMSKVSRDEPDACCEMKNVDPVSSGPSTKQRLTKSALKRKHCTLSSVSFSDDTEPKQKKPFPKVAKRKLFISETDSGVKRKCSNSSITSPDISPIAPFNVSLLASSLSGFSKASSGSSLSLKNTQSGSSLSVEHTQYVTGISKLADDEVEDPLSQNDSDVSSDMSSEIMFPTSNRTKLWESVIENTNSYDAKNELEDVFRSVCQPEKSSKFTKQSKRLKAFSTFMKSFQSVYTKMKKTEREIKRTEAETSILWFQQSQKMKNFRSTQEDSLVEMRKVYDTFTDQLQIPQSGEENFKVSMKKSLTKDYEDLKKNLRAKHNAHSLEAIKRCLQASIMLS